MLVDLGTTLNDEETFLPWFRGASWDGWRTILKAAFGLAMTPDEIAFFRTVADRDPPAKPVKEIWLIAGRRSGKDSVASVIAAHVASFFGHSDLLRPGERALVACLACDKDQSKIVLNYSRSYFRKIPALLGMVTRQTATGFELSNGVDIAVSTNSFRQVRGRPILCAILDECAFFRDETSANPDRELYQAIKPGLATLPGSILIGISSPYRRAGLLYEKWRKHYGKDDDDVLVIRAPSILLNPTLDRAIIDKALEEDPQAAAAEWNAEWRNDIGAFVDPEVVDACVVPGRHELPPLSDIAYVGFFDAAGGSGADSFASAVAHFDAATQHLVLDAVREARPPFSPEATIEEHAAFFMSYGVTRVVSDRWGGEFPAEHFRKRGIQCDVSERVKSDLYKELLPALNSGRVELLENSRLINQLVGLERRVARSGKDSIDHPPGGHDDIANAAAGALIQCLVPRVYEREFNWTGVQLSGPDLSYLRNMY